MSPWAPRLSSTKFIHHPSLTDHRYITGYNYRSIYSNLAYLVLWARSEKIGDAVNQGRGLMEYWIAGMLGLVD
jgi:hypothetical protein